MKRLLMKHFIPHEGNDHKPHFLRIGSVLALIGLVLGLEAGYLAEVAPFISPQNTALVEPAVLVDETNDARAGYSLPILKTNPLLEKAAQLKANDMAEKGYFSHDTPDGLTPWYWFGLAGYSYRSAGENLAVNFTESRDVTNAWLNSPGHRANILSGKYQEIGIATAEGIYQGRKVTFVVELFGLPSLSSVPPQAASAPTKKAIVAKVPAVAPAPAPTPEPEEKPEAESPDVQGVAIEPIQKAPIEAEQSEIQTLPPVTTGISTPPVETQASTVLVMSVLLSIAALIMLALFLKVFVKIRIQHPALIGNGVLALIVVGACIGLNLHLFSFI